MKPETTRNIFASYLCFLLAGYLFLNKGFAYVGFYPIYIGETGLIVGVICLLILTQKKAIDWPRLHQPTIYSLVVFIIWQSLRTIPFLGQYKLDAIRDAMVWGYAAFTFLLLLILGERYKEVFFLIYRVVLPVYLGWILLYYMIFYHNQISIFLFSSSVSILRIKFGDIGVQLGAIAAFLLLGISRKQICNWFSFLLWGIWWTNWFLYGAGNRGAMLSALIALLIAVILGWTTKKRTIWKPCLIAAVIITLVFKFFLPDYYQRIEYNFLSLAGRNISSVGDPLRLRTVEWRFQWWNKIIDYTVYGEYFWEGKGYGINLADSDGFQVMADHSLRSPHNVFMTILARSGVPGLILWIVFLGALGFQLIRNILARDSSETYVRKNIWFLATFGAFLFNASFDVFLEGPMGGIWFWSLIGFALMNGEKILRPKRDEVKGKVQTT